MKTKNKETGIGCAVLIVAAIIFIGIGIAIHKFFF